jgi:DNA-binding Lrp family transcriptional regulator
MNSMRNALVLPNRSQPLEIDIYSNKSALVLFWLLAHRRQSQKEGLSINELARSSQVSVGQVHKVIKHLEYEGIIKAKGLRTNKKFLLDSPKAIFQGWLSHYQILKKARSRGFARSSPITALQKQKLFPALHTSCKTVFGIKSTNIRGEEFYLAEWNTLPKLIDNLGLQELERGYEILLIDPYYSALVSNIMDKKQRKTWLDSYQILTFLDLFHYPLRGIEEAEVLFRKSSILNKICPWKEIESASR